MIWFTTGLFIIFISGSLWAIRLQSLHSAVFLLFLFVSALLSAVICGAQERIFKLTGWKIPAPGEFIKPTANELGSANVSKRMNVWKAAGPCIILALKNETDFEQCEMDILFCSQKCVREERDCTRRRTKKKVWARTGLCKGPFSRDSWESVFSRVRAREQGFSTKVIFAASLFSCFKGEKEMKL